MGQPALRSGRSAQSDARQQGPRVDDVEDSRQHGSGLVQRSQATSTPNGSRCTRSGRQASYYDPEDAAVHADRHLLLHAPPAVRQRSRRDRVLQRAERSRSSAGSTPRSTTRPRHDEAKPSGGGLVRAGGRHQRRRKDHQAVELYATPSAARISVLYATRHRRRAVRRAAAARQGRRKPGAVRSQAGHAGHLTAMYSVIPSPVDDSVWGVSEALSRLS